MMTPRVFSSMDDAKIAPVIWSEGSICADTSGADTQGCDTHGQGGQMKTKLPRCPGIKYGPWLNKITWNGTDLYRVQQSGFWQDSSIHGPFKSTEKEAVRAWKRMLKAQNTKKGK